MSFRFGLLAARDFRRLFAAAAAAQFGDRIVFLALPLTAIAVLDVSEFQVGLLTAATTAGALLVGLPAGAWVDRLRRRTVLINTDLARAVVMATIPLAWWTGTLTIWQLYAVALAHGVLTVFFDVASRAYLPHLVGRENLVEANAKLTAVGSVTSIAGPSAVGPLLTWLSAPVALAGTALMLLTSAVTITSIRDREPAPRPRPDTRLRAEIKDGWSFVVLHRQLRAAVGSVATFSLFLIVYQSMLLVFLARDLGLGSPGIGLILSGMGCGGVLGALVASRVLSRIGFGRALWILPAVTCPLTALLPLARPGWSLFAAAGCLAMLSLGGVIRMVASASIQQSLTPDELLGRVTATSRFLTSGALPLGGLVGGIIGSVAGASGTLLIGAAGMTLSALPAFLSPLRTMRRLPEVSTNPEPSPAQ